MCLDGATQRWWCCDQAHFPHSRKTHVERSGDRGCRQRENVDVLAQHLDLFLLIHTEALFFIHHQKSKLLKRGSFAQQLMGSHHSVDCSLFEAIENAFAL